MGNDVSGQHEYMGMQNVAIVIRIGKDEHTPYRATLDVARSVSMRVG